MSDRGDYRSWYAAIVDDPDFQALTPLAFKTLFVLKMTLGAAGIGIARRLVLQEQIGCTDEQLEAALVELEAPKPDGARGWIARERNIVWIVNGLKFEPTLSATNATKHRPFVRRLIQPLGDRPIVRDFIAYYATWFDSCPMPENGDRVSDTPAYPMDRVSVGNRNTSDSDSDENQPQNQQQQQRASEGQSISPDRGPSSSDGTAVARSREIARTFFAEFYHDAPDRLKRSVHREMKLALSDEGVLYKRQRVRAVSQEHLDQVLAEVLQDGGRIEQPHSAWAIALTKLADTSRPAPGRITGDAMAKHAEEDNALSRRYQTARAAEIDRWRRTHEAEYAAIEARARAAQPGDTGIAAVMREGIIQDEAGKACGFPDEDAWRAHRRAS